MNQLQLEGQADLKETVLPEGRMMGGGDPGGSWHFLFPSTFLFLCLSFGVVCLGLESLCLSMEDLVF